MFDLRVYYVLDAQAAGERDLAALAAAARRGGATAVQLRDKRGDARQTVADARAVAEACGDDLPLIVNDRVDVALCAHAAGVHVGSQDIHPYDARRLLGPTQIVGLSIHDATQAAGLKAIALDYAGVGPAFATTTKANARAPIGPSGVGALVAAVKAARPALPVCAIGGIDVASAGAMIAAGADGVAVASAITAADDPEAATAALRAAVDAALGERAAA
ncbi:MAG: thiamine phosphate synthase [Pseudomonadota bacterium]